MRFVFWQNIVSIHQSAFLSALAMRYPVILVAQYELDNERKGDGWQVPDIKGVKILVPKKEEEWSCLLEDKDMIHVFSGINSFPLVYEAFKIAYKRKLHLITYMEPYVWNDVFGFLRKCKYMYLNLKYGNGIQGILSTGQTGVNCYLKAGYKKEKIFQWGYFTDSASVYELVRGDRKKVRLLFVGRLDKNKNCLKLIDICKQMQNDFDYLTIVGGGCLEECVEKEVQSTPSILYKGVLSNKQVNLLMQEHDILILPSQYDGWGAVVNEALQNGLRVIASESCGSSILLDGKIRGEIFYFKGGDSLEIVLKRWIMKGPISVEERKEIVDWTKGTISGISAATYFIQICDYIFNKKGERPIAPWLIK